MKNNFFLFAILFFLASCQEKFDKGRVLYNTHCASCHMEDGSGLRKLYPPLNQADYLLNNKDLLPCIIVNGMEDSISVNGVWFKEIMDPIIGLSNTEIAAIINFIHYEMGDKSFITREQVKAQLINCKEQNE